MNIMRRFASRTSPALILLIALLLGACASSPTEDSQRLIDEGKPEAALALLASAMKEAPRDQSLRIHYYRVRDTLTNQALTAADRARLSGRNEEALRQTRLAAQLDPDNARAKDMLRLLDADGQRAARQQEAERLYDARQYVESEAIVRGLLADTPNNPAARNLLRKLDDAQNTTPTDSPVLKGAFSKPITLEFRDTPLRAVFEAISRTAGINFVFDKDVRPDTRVTVFVRNTTLDEVVRMVLSTNGLERKLLNDNSLLIYPSSAAKQRDYQELVTRTFYLTNTDAKQAQSLIKTIVKTKDTFIDEKLNLLIIKDTADAVRMAERLIVQLDVADPEVMLDVEVLEVLRSRLTDLGIRYPEQIGYGLLTPTTTSVVTTTTGTTQSTNLGGTVSTGNINLRNTGALIPYAANPGLLLNLKDQDGSSNILANPRIRVQNKEKAKIHIGDKLPVFTTTSTANVGVSASVNYLDVGLKLDVEPTVRLDDDVEIKVGLEVSSVTKEVTGPGGSLAYQVGTRNANTVLRLRDGETQVLAGLISDEERSSGSHIPGIGRIPLLGRLFSDKSSSNSKTEIILLITPHVVRNITPTGASRASVPAGTEAAIGAAPMRVTSATPARSLEVRGGGAAGSPQAASASPSSPPARGSAADGINAAITLTGPNRVTPGQEFTVSIAASADTLVRGGEATLSWDGALFENPADGGSTTKIQLTTTGNGAQGQLKLRAKAKASGDGIVEIANLRIMGENDDLSTSAPPALAVKVAP